MNQPWIYMYSPSRSPLPDVWLYFINFYCWIVIYMVVIVIVIYIYIHHSNLLIRGEILCTIPQFFCKHNTVFLSVFLKNEFEKIYTNFKMMVIIFKIETWRSSRVWPMTLTYLSMYLRMQTLGLGWLAKYRRGMQAPCATQVLWKDRSGWSGKRMAFRRISNRKWG